MILVDSSVWIDYFRDAETPETAALDSLLGVVPLAVDDLILTEVLQGIGPDRQFERVSDLMRSLEFIELGGERVAVEAARNYRKLRSLGVTVRKTIDTVIATRCILDGHSLLFSDRDFVPFVTHLGLRSALD